MKIVFSFFTLEQRSKKSMFSLTLLLTCKMNGLKILSKRPLNGRIGYVGPAATDRSLKSLGSKTSTYLLFCLAIACDIKADLLLFGRHYKLLAEAEKFVK